MLDKSLGLPPAKVSPRSFHRLAFSARSTIYSVPPLRPDIVLEMIGTTRRSDVRNFPSYVVMNCQVIDEIPRNLANRCRYNARRRAGRRLKSRVALMDSIGKADFIPRRNHRRNIVGK